MPEVDSAVDAELAGFVREHFEHVLRTLLRLGVRSTDADDLVQEVFLVVQRRFNEIDRTRPVRAWLFGVARRVAASHRRSMRSRTAHESDEEHDIAMIDPAVPALEAADLVHAALRDLDESLRDALVLHDLDEVPAAEAAETLGIAVPTLYARVRQGREGLARAVRRLRAEGGET